MDILKSKIDEILALVYSMEIRDSYTQGHSERVAYYATKLASIMKLSKKDIEDVYIAGLLHDLGKIGIPDVVLLKPGKLEKEEYDLIKQHSVLSGEIVKRIPNFSYLEKVVRHHHENFDGSGYPDGLKGNEIPLLSRILSIVDVFDALTTKRVYRADINLDKSIQIMQEMQKNKKFDLNIFKIFIPFIKKHGVLKHKSKSPLNLKELEKIRYAFFYNDQLTQLLNKTAFLTLLRKIYDYKYKTTLIFINIKDFKFYNQKYGIKKGDEALKRVAKILKCSFNGTTQIKEPHFKDLFIFRSSDDKFLILYIGAKYEFFKYKLDQISKKIEKSINIEIEYTFLLHNKPIYKNFEEDIGYLL